MQGIPSTLTTANSQPLATNRAQDQKSQFLKILVAQLKGQNPLDPQDGAQFVSQLAQFSSLEELINIRSAIEMFQKTFDQTGAKTDTSNPIQ
jgi:flagellar basal-body rod modification protein FlgD